jgi:hypothetical protein
MSELVKSRPEAAVEPRVDADNIDWVRLMQEALTMPGRLSTVYSRFYRYSFLNQMLLYMQGVTAFSPATRPLLVLCRAELTVR